MYDSKGIRVYCDVIFVYLVMHLKNVMYYMYEIVVKFKARNSKFNLECISFVSIMV